MLRRCMHALVISARGRGHIHIAPDPERHEVTGLHDLEPEMVNGLLG